MPPLNTADDLREMVAEKELDVKKGFELAGSPELADAFISQLPAAQVEKKQYYKGDSFAWMMFKRKGAGKVKVARDVTWGADEPFWGFSFNIDQDKMRYTYCVPLGCGNIALVGVMPVPEPPVVVPPPVVEETPAPPPVEEVNPFRFLLDAGYYAQFDPGSYIFGRIGGEYRISDQYSVLGLIGASPQVGGEDGESAFLVDILGEYKMSSSLFLNIGIGAWLSDGENEVDTEDTQLDIIAALGVQIYDRPDKINASLFIEMRSAPDEFDDLKGLGRFGAGVRFKF
ncbi:MAG: hypothetical protein CSA32_05740 [Desulfobulbus propionicus]|nr:MAG: hypothetical protein CSA32_05740 [Desulfobulbus propionicus]